MRLAITFALAVAAATTSRQDCGNGTPPPPYDPCAEKACGESCTVCAPDCVETAVVKACDPFHQCVPQTPALCAATQDGCAGKSCGTECTIDPPCRSAVPPCMMPSVLGNCDPSGACIAGAPTPNFCPPPPPPPRVTSCEGQACGVRCEFPCPQGATGCGASPLDAVCDGAGHCLSPTCCGPPPPPECYRPPPSWGCVGKACGDSCGVCPPGTDPASCPVPTFAATACDAGLQCVTVGTFMCAPEAACRGKACGDPCDTCGGACARPHATACDSGYCVPAPVTCAPQRDGLLNGLVDGTLVIGPETRVELPTRR